LRQLHALETELSYEDIVFFRSLARADTQFEDAVAVVPMSSASQYTHSLSLRLNVLCARSAAAVAARSSARVSDTVAVAAARQLAIARRVADIDGASDTDRADRATR
jgi:hypothetical protein